jgi:threo-3-hydroxy-L-aspartate ammonia-lyase
MKAENLQRGGSFKIRGAFNRISTLETRLLAAGVATYSSGNHAQAVAIAAALCRTHAVILMPEDTPSIKMEATLHYGAEIIPYDRYKEDRTELGAQLARDRGLTLVPPYDDPMVMAGQGTVALELLEQAGTIDCLIAPVGGGGLIAGCGTVSKLLRPTTQVIGVEPRDGDDTWQSLKAGKRTRLPTVPRTIADGLQADIPGTLTFEINQRIIDEIVLVTDDEILAAMRFLFERLKTVVEPSGAVGVAAVLARKVDVIGRRIGIVISGGNIDVNRFAELLRR